MARRIESRDTRTLTTGRRTPLQYAALLVGAVFLLVGIAGFIPGITTNADDLEFVGHDSDAELLGVFRVNVLHNLVHVLFGLVGLASARTTIMARSFLVGGGVVYLALWVYGIAIELDSDWNFVSLDDADNWLHLGLGAGMIAVGLALPNRTAPTTTTRSTTVGHTGL